jgi:hypothetical protein
VLKRNGFGSLESCGVLGRDLSGNPTNRALPSIPGILSEESDVEVRNTFLLIRVLGGIIALPGDHAFFNWITDRDVCDKVRTSFLQPVLQFTRTLDLSDSYRCPQFPDGTS